MKKPIPGPEAAPPALPQTGGSWVREKDGTLRLEEATDNTPEARRAAEDMALKASVEDPVQDLVKEA